MRRFCKAGALLAFAALLTVTRGAAAETPPPKECVRAYVIADDFRAAVRKMEARPDSTAVFRGLSAYVDGFSTIDFDARADALAKRFPDQVEGGVFPVKLDVAHVGEDLLGESASGPLSALLAPEKVYAEQRRVLALARACDLAYEFAPALGEAPTPERTIALLREKLDKEIKADKARLAALDDTECAIRFTLAGNMFPPGSPGQQSMMQRLQIAGSKAMAAQAGLTEERLLTIIQRGVTERAEKMKNGKYKGEMLIEEVKACETRLGLPLSGLKLNAGG